MKTTTRIFYGCILMLLFCLLGKTVWAQREPVYVDPLLGDSGQIKVGSKMIVKDSVFFDSLLKPTINQTYHINNLISLRINEGVNKVMPDSFSLSVKLKLIYIAPDTLSDSINQKVLTINYYKNKPYNDKAIFYFQGAHYVEAQILEITSQYADTSAILPLVMMENRMVINRDYVMNCTNDAIGTITKDISSLAQSGELKLSWIPNGVSQMYDLEWTFIDKSAIDNGRYNSGGIVDGNLIFKNNTTRITTKANEYFVPLLYDGEGTLFYRVRGATIDGNGEVKTTQWSSEANPNPSSWSHVFAGHETNLNWQATTTFAEDGKRKSVVQYYDGSLRGRQTVTRDNTTDTTIIAETFYDKQGRPMIQVMPAPSLSRLLKYTPGFNVKDINNNEYNKSLYDTLLNVSDYCDTGAPPMDSISGASQYYSSLNPDVNIGFHKYIPKAYGYAFSETQYTSDNTGRIYRQGGVGPDFRIGSGHETKYYYSSAGQKELDALFGTEVGDASHYQKNMVRDANGQYSVSYVDMHGRTIATALAGSVPQYPQALSSFYEDTYSEQLLTPTNNMLNGSSIEFSKTLLMTKDDNVTFRYSLGNQSLSIEDCKNDSICYDCLYDITIKITGDCAGCVSDKNDTTLKLSNVPLFRIDTTCGLAIPVDTTLTVFLKEGSYNVTKTLTISQQGLDYYRDSVFLARNTCISYDSFFNAQLQIAKNSLDCNPPTLSTASYLQYREQMLIDMYPMQGQYADTALNRECFSIFDETNGKYFYQIAVLKGGPYKDADGNEDYVVNDAGKLVRPEELNPNEFVANFKDSWAQTLLNLHPEYLLLLEYEKFSASHIWDDDFFETDTYAEAVAKGYLNPTSSTAAPANKFSFGNDPLFENSIGEAALSAINDSLFRFRIDNSNPSNPLTLWGFATAVAKCSNPVTQSCIEYWNQSSMVFDSTSLCEGELDMAWRTFRAIYLEKKREWIENYIRQQFGSIQPKSCRQVFLIKDSVLAIDGFTGNGEQDYAKGTSQLNQYYTQNCEAYKERWRQQLEGCYTETQVNQIIERLVNVCKEGADESHPYGSSTVKPSSQYQYRSFEQAIREYNDSLAINSITCNPYLIDKPLPYEQQSTVLVQKPVLNKPDSCTCEKLNGLYNAYQNSSSEYDNFSDYVQQTLGTTISEMTLDSLLGLCSGVISCNFISKPLLIPPALQCGIEGTCISCEEYQVAFDNFKEMFPGSLPTLEENDTSQQLINRVFANYMNLRFGFSKSAVEYLNFGSSCDLHPPNIADTLQTYVQDFKESYQEFYVAIAQGQVYKQYKITPAATAMIEGANALLKARHELPLPIGYAISTAKYDFTNKLRSISKTASTDSFYNLVLPLPTKFTSQFGPYASLENNTIYSTDFVTGPVTQKQLSTKYYATSFGIRSNYFRNIWSEKYRTISYSYYGHATPPLKYLPDTTEGSSDNHVYYTTFYKINSSVNSPSTFNSYFANDVYQSGVGFTAAAYNYNDVVEIKNLRFATEFLPFSNMSAFMHSAIGLKVTLKLKDSTETDAYWYSNYNGSPYVQYKEALDTNQFNPDCKVAFTYYFNQQRGTSYTASQVDSFYMANQGALPQVCGDISSLNCDDLKKLVQEYYFSSVNPASRVVELDMRTFAGNKTPLEGPKGVFNVYGALIGNTPEGTMQEINNSFAQIWNSDTVNAAIGNLTALTNGRFLLQLNPGKEVPCNGIIGQRYFQYDLGVKDTAVNLGHTSEGSYVDFGDSTHVFVEPQFVDGQITYNDGKTQIYEDDETAYFVENLRYMPEYKPYKFLQLKHTYSKTVGENKWYTLTFYHTDLKGVMDFNADYRPTGTVQGRNLRGYWPQETLAVAWTDSQDSTFARTRLIKNFKEITTIQRVYLHSSSSTRNINLESFENNKNLQYLYFGTGWHSLDSVTVQAVAGTPFYKMFPNLPVNFPKLGVLRLIGFRYKEGDFDSLNFSLPNLKHLEIYAAHLKSYQIDTILNQLVRVNIKDSGTSFYNYVVPSDPPTSASSTAYQTLKNRNWNFWGIGTDPQRYYNSPRPVDKEPFIKTNALTDYINEKLQTNFTFTELVNTLSPDSSNCVIDLDPCNLTPGTLSEIRLCGKSEPMNELIDVQPEPCADSTNLAIAAAMQLYQLYQDSVKGQFNETYTRNCLKVTGLESFTITKPISEYHYTLYYYDQAGNLVKTIPPKAVQPNRDTAWLELVKQKRAAGETEVPIHATDPLATIYRYNSLNQVVSQKSPDGGKAEFWYDRLGRLVVSQNAKQKLGDNYSYTLYDEIGRITEVGEKYNVLGMSQTTSRSPLLLKKWIQYRNFESAFLPRMVTYTLYDILNPYADDYSGYTPFKQKAYTLRNRVSMTRYYAGGLGQQMVVDGTDTSYRPHYWWPSTGVDYSYDIHGNVDSMLTIAWDGSFMSQVNNSFSYRYIGYKYDLISGKVNEVHYQGSNAQYKFADEFYYRYEYDADNRLTDVYTTDNRAFLGQQGLEEHDARYEYYKHGPLARVVIGQQQVQGTDYAYTLQGWLKGINSTALNSNIDMGEDGKSTSGNKGIARDVYGFNLNYFTGEYAAINGNIPFPGHTAFMPGSTYKPLYNGNISSAAVNIGKLNQLQLYNYGYDQLNRIVSMDVYRGFDQANNNWNSLSAVNDYKERIAYDANGNILKYLRQGYGSVLGMDSLNYNYNAGTNQLNHIRDQVASTAYSVDIDNQSANNYTYDALGNLVTDVQERVTGTTWNVYGKISDVTRSFAGHKTASTHFQYDPSGNRVGKVISTFYEGDRKYWYIRDAQGNVMAVYYSETNPNWTNGPVRLQEHHLYGSSRLGIQKKDFDISQPKVTAVNANLVGPTYLYTTVRGDKAYELTNHLGNVLTTVSDRKIGHVNGSSYDYYDAEVVSATDYYPFGMEMVGRTFSSPSYRYGFNGKEKDDEAKGSGAQYDYGFRIYDPRAGRFLSVDPLFRSYPWYTPYQFAGNKPVWAIDLDGLEEKKVTHHLEKRQDGTFFIKSTDVDIDLNRYYTVTDKNTGKEIKQLAKTTLTYEYKGEHYDGKVLWEDRMNKGIKPSAAYNYTDDEGTGATSMKTKWEEDKKSAPYIGEMYNPGNAVYFKKLLDRDMKAPDNSITLQNFEILDVVGGIIEKRLSNHVPKIAPSPILGAKQNKRAPETEGGEITESGFLRAAQKFLGKDYEYKGDGRYVSKDGLRQVRYGRDETKNSNKHHAHFEAYDKPSDKGGNVIENRRVTITKG
jgi:RHS repeat-associated protein